jgi:1-deoxy-D-xylulose-5-phosphate reductoisomerase
LPPLDFSKLSKNFYARYDDFPALNLARQAGETGCTLPAVMNAQPAKWRSRSWIDR